MVYDYGEQVKSERPRVCKEANLIAPKAPPLRSEAKLTADCNEVIGEKLHSCA